MRFFLISVCQVLLFSSLFALSANCEDKTHDPRRWEAEIKKFEAADRSGFPEPGGILFVGSSSIRLWDLPRYFPGENVINRGFGGSHTEDSLYYVDRIVLPYKPRIIVLYAGDNDIAAGKSPARVERDFVQFAQAVRKGLPEAHLVYVAIKPSIRRWSLATKMNEANGRIAKACLSREHLHFLDIYKPMLGEDGHPQANLFVKDGLHLNAQGYELWTRILKPLLSEIRGSRSQDVTR